MSISDSPLLRFDTKSRKYHPRQSVDCSDPLYKRRTCGISRIPPTEVGGLFRSCLQRRTCGILRIPPTEVGGWFRSSLRNKAIQTQSKAISATCTFCERRPDLNNPPTSVGGIFVDYASPPLYTGSEQSPNSRWGDLRAFVRRSCCREDLNNPPTAVGGICTDTPSGLRSRKTRTIHPLPWWYSTFCGKLLYFADRTMVTAVIVRLKRPIFSPSPSIIMWAV
jgi:hypothetical protein